MTIKGAGVLPFTTFRGQSYFLMAEEGGIFSGRRWGDLGGKLDGLECAKWGAAREANEESRGVLGCRLAILFRLIWPLEAVTVRSYRSYILKYRVKSLKDIPRRFSQTHLPGHSYNEVNKLAWVKTSEIYRAVMQYRAGSGSSVSTSSGKTLSGRCIGVIRRSSGYRAYAARKVSSIVTSGSIPVIKLRNGRAFAVTQQGSTAADLRFSSRSPTNPAASTFLPHWVTQEEREAIFQALQQESIVHRIYRYVTSFFWNSKF